MSFQECGLSASGARASAHWRGDERERRIAHDAFMMDFENWVLQHRWDARQCACARAGGAGIPTGRERHKDALWAALMQEEIAFSDTTWAAYVAWVEAGGGDEWFQEPNSDHDKWTHDSSNSTRTPEGLGQEPSEPMPGSGGSS